ncbi:hypothetical protein AB0451_08025 [Streptomyces sp. NPDC052000]|uniref:hypothetical protein n=1 Tax=Streptomyces sp. NPDC052000 TaxID=3155676 RepID=UPI00344EAB03
MLQGVEDLLHFLNGNVGTLTVGAISKPPAGAGKDGGSWEVSMDTLTKYAPEAQDFTLYLNTAPDADKKQSAPRSTPRWPPPRR